MRAKSQSKLSCDTFRILLVYIWNPEGAIFCSANVNQNRKRISSIEIKNEDVKCEILKKKSLSKIYSDLLQQTEPCLIECGVLKTWAFGRRQNSLKNVKLKYNRDTCLKQNITEPDYFFVLKKIRFIGNVIKSIYFLTKWQWYWKSEVLSELTKEGSGWLHSPGIIIHPPPPQHNMVHR